jgi:site-specific recombinase XerD
METRYGFNFEKYLHLQRFSPKTREAYLRAVSGLSEYQDKPAYKLTNPEIQEYLRYCIQDRQLAWSSCNIIFCGLKCYYDKYLGWDKSRFSIPPRPRSKQLPMILSREEVKRIIEAPTNFKHQTLLATVYGSGLRASEVVRLRPEHIESSRMLLRVENGKGRKDRYTVLSKKGLEQLRNYWRKYQPGEWVFFGRDKNKPMSISTSQRVFYQAKAKAGITKARGIHTLRHCFATHSMDVGVDLHIIKRWLGHRSMKTTFKYLHVTPEMLGKVKSPLDLEVLS